MTGKLYLIPNTLGGKNINLILPKEIFSIITSLKYLIVEDLRNARRYLKLIDREIEIDEIEFFELNKHTEPGEVKKYLQPALNGHHMGVLSEAGLPGIADPGASIVRFAHENDVMVVPLTGPSSIFLALMASGLNGQSFTFHGYLPIQKNERQKSLKQLEKVAVQSGQTQIFIETPYRNNALMKDLLETCSYNTLLTVAVDISLETENILTRKIADWKSHVADLHKRPAVFLIGRPY